MDKIKTFCTQKFQNGHPLLIFEMRLLGWLGFYNFFTPKGSCGNRLINTIFYLYQCFLCAFCASFLLTLMGDLYAVKNNLILLGEDLCIIIGVCLIIFKAFQFVLKCEDIKDMIHEIEMLIIRNDPSDERFEHRFIQDTFVFVECSLTTGFHCLSFLLLIALILAPSSSNNLPLSAWYPFEIENETIHRLMLAYQTSAVIYALISIVGIDSCTGILWHQLSMQFQILHDEFKSSEGYCLAQVSSETSSDENSIHMSRLVVLIKRHQHLLTLAARMNEITSSMLTAQIIASNFMICLTGFEATLTLNETKACARFAMHLSSALSQLLFWCIYGDMVRSGSTRIAKAAFVTAWHKRDAEYVKRVSFIIMRAQKSVDMKAGYMNVLNLETFVTILSGSYSYFALLRSLNATE